MTNSLFKNFKPAYKIWLDLEGNNVFGQGIFSLLQAIEETGAIKLAAFKLNMSYRAAWGKIKTTEERLGFTLVEKHQGGNGGANLTKDAREFMKNFHQWKLEVEEVINCTFQKYFHYDTPGLKK